MAPEPDRLDSLEIRNLSCLATPSGRTARAGHEQGALRVIPDAAVRCENGTIVFVGAESELRRRHFSPALREIDGVGGTLLPGFVDAHTHPVWAGDRAEEFARRLAGASYAEIAAAGGGILSTVEATRRASDEDLIRGTVARLMAMARSGTTTAECKTGYDLTEDGELRCLDLLRVASTKAPVRIVSTLLAAHGIPPEFRDDRREWVRRICTNIIPRAAAGRKAEFCDVFCDEGYFTADESRTILEAARRAGLKLRIHADELALSGGARVAAELAAVSADHLLFIGVEEIDLLRRSDTVATLLPGTSWGLKSRRAPARQLVAASVPVAIATDANPGTCNTESLPAVAGHACHDDGLSIEETITAITLNGAASLGRAESLGSIEEGKLADFVLLDAPDYRHLIYHWGINLVRMTIVGGVVYES